MFLASSSVAAAKRDSLIAFYGPFVSAFILVVVIVAPGSPGVPELQISQNIPVEAATPLLSPAEEVTFEAASGAEKNLNTTAIYTESYVAPLLWAAVAAADAQAPVAVQTVAPISIQLEPAIPNEQVALNRTSEDEVEPALIAVSHQTEATEALPAALYSQNEAEIADSSLESAKYISWGELADSLAGYDGPQLTLKFDQEIQDGNSDDRLQRPDTFQRPALPPAQLVRPIQRAGILPPPIRALIP